MAASQLCFYISTERDPVISMTKPNDPEDEPLGPERAAIHLDRQAGQGTCMYIRLDEFELITIVQGTRTINLDKTRLFNTLLALQKEGKL